LDKVKVLHAYTTWKEKLEEKLFIEAITKDNDFSLVE
jgi:hypothetical protein